MIYTTSSQKALFYLALFLAFFPILIQAHATLDVSSAKSGSYYKAVLNIPHGCEGEATREVQVKLPEGFINVKPMPKPGWNMEIRKGTYQKTYELHGEEVKAVPLEIHWKGGMLHDVHFDEFVLHGKLGDFLQDTHLPFVITQVCATQNLTWNQIPTEGQDPHSRKHPAPILHVRAGSHEDGHHSNQMENKASEKMAIMVKNAWIRAVPPNSKMSAAYMTLHNSSEHHDMLAAVESPLANAAELHNVVEENEMMMMMRGQ